MTIKFKKFTVEQKSSFSYWFYHWLAFNYTAWKLGVWKPKWLLHDIEKPWLKLIWGDYLRVRKWHKHHNSHHIFYGRRYGMNKIDWLGAVIDWECSHFTKEASPYVAKDEFERFTEENYFKDKYPMIYKYCYNEFCSKLSESLGKLNLI